MNKIDNIISILLVCIGLVILIGLMQYRDFTVKQEIQQGVTNRWQAAKQCATDESRRETETCRKILALLPKVIYSHAL